MPLEKQSLNNFLPNGFETLNQEGYKENFSADKIATGYEKDVPDIVSGPNLNNLIDVVGKNTNVLSKFMDFIKNMPVNNTLKVNSANQLDYEDVSDLNNKVSKAGDTMTGDLIINKNGGHFRISGTGWKGLAGSNPEADITATDQTDKQGTRVISYDKNGAIMGYLQTFIDKNGSVVTGLNAQRRINSELLQSAITVGVDNQGNKYTSAITPSEDDKSNRIATTEWVRKQASKDGFPSNKKVTLTLGATPESNYYVSEHVAPANGWFWILWECNGSNDYVQMRNKENIYRFQTPERGERGYYSFMLPFKKGETCRITYLRAPKLSDLRFLYSEGNQ